MLKFNKPTLIAITAPTCSGKSYLLNELVSKQGFGRIVSTTTRHPRRDEKEGIDYNFISNQQSKEAEADGLFFELVEFNKTRYGVTHVEMKKKMEADTPPVVVLEPNGLEIYMKKCFQNGWDIFKIYVHCVEEQRLQRLLHRTIANSWDVVDMLQPSPGKYTNEFFQTGAEIAKRTLSQLATEHQRRVVSCTSNERRWINLFNWDLVVPGDDLPKAVKMVEEGIALRNTRVAAGMG